MHKLVSVYNSAFRSLNSSGPNDPTTTVFMVPASCEFPQRLMDAGVLRFIATEFGGIIWASPETSQSISRDGEVIKNEVLSAILANVREGTIAGLTADLKETVK